MNKIIQRRLLVAASIFLALQTLIITLAPAVRARSWNADYQFSQWIALGLWGLFVARTHYDISRKLPDADPYLFPAAALLGGWGLLTIWWLHPNFGARQALWLSISLIVVSLGVHFSIIDILRRYKYTLLTCGLALTALTLIFGTNPSGSGPRLWLGYQDLYLQPSEPLKFLLIVFLAAYLAEKIPSRLRIIHILYPTLILSGIVILLLIVQRDLGTAAIFTALYTIIIYLATGRRRILIVMLLILILVGVAGYNFVDIIHARMASWLNPWNDPSGSSYQIIQALLAVANGGIVGRGPGLGSPGLVPVAISDFIYATIAEETGLIGTLGLLAVISLIIARGLRAALRAPNLFRRILAAGITTYFGVQTILIVGGNIRLLPLTGVTLPFVSYGGSSLLTSFVSLLILLHISNHLDKDPAPLLNAQPYVVTGAILMFGFFAAALANGWWSIYRGPDLLTRPDNRRRTIEESYVPRGALLDNTNKTIDDTQGGIGNFSRHYEYPDLAPVTGYIDSIYGQAGLEASLDDYLRGTQGYPTSTIFWNHMLYGMDPPGLDVRLSIDLKLQAEADNSLAGHHGAVILMNAQSGEIRVMASHPTFDPNQLSDTGAQLAVDPGRPLINRATQGQYPTGSIMEPFVRALYGRQSVATSDLVNVYDAFGFFHEPQIRLPVAPAPARQDLPAVRVTPLQMALATTALSNQGRIPAPRIATAVDTPREGWVSLQALGMPIEAIPVAAWNEAISPYLSQDQTHWQAVGFAGETGEAYTWYIGGTPPNWQATPLVVVVLLEESNKPLAQQLGEGLLKDAMTP